MQLLKTYSHQIESAAVYGEATNIEQVARTLTTPRRCKLPLGPWCVYLSDDTSLDYCVEFFFKILTMNVDTMHSL